jgi:hypothetical protein
MKTNYLKFRTIYKIAFKILVVVLAVALVSSCASKKVITKVDRKEIKRPFDDFLSDKKAFRAVGIQTSPDMSFAIEMAGNDARQKIAAQINSFVKNVSEDFSGQFAKSQYGGVDRDFYAKMEALGYNIVQQQISNAIIKGDRVFEVKNKKQGIVYEAHVAIELNRDDFENAYGTGIKNMVDSDDKMETDFRLQQFKDTFDKQMDEFVKSQNGN